MKEFFFFCRINLLHYNGKLFHGKLLGALFEWVVMRERELLHLCNYCRIASSQK
jgi:hypothetical protein